MTRLPVRRRLSIPAAGAWDLLTDVTAWPRWGPSLREASLDGGGDRIGPGARGRLRAVGGLWLPFEVTGWEPDRSWSWRVAGIAATSHTVEARPGGAGCTVEIGVPLWAAPYGALCWAALGALEGA